MAKNKKNKKENSGEALFGRLGRGSAKNNRTTDEEELLSFEAEETAAEEFDSIDITGDADPSDSDLDINELLRKYMPEYSEEEASSGGSGVLSRLKQTKADAEQESTADDKLISALDSVFSRVVEEPAEELEYTEEYTEEEFAEEYTEEEYSEEYTEEEFADESSGEEYPEEEYEEEVIEELPQEPRKKSGLFGRIGLFGKKSRRKDPDTPSEGEVLYDELPEEEVYDEIPEEETAYEEIPEEDFVELQEEDAAATEESFEDAEEWFEEESEEQEEQEEQEELLSKPKKKRFGFWGRKKKELPEEELVLEEELEESYEELTEGGLPEEEFGEEALDGDGVLTEETEFAEEPEFVDEEAQDAALAALAMEVLREAEDEVQEEAGEETELRLDLEEETDGSQDFEEAAGEDSDDQIDSTDMNLMIAFGLDGKGDKKADRAKEFGDRLEAKQQSHEAKKVKLDRPEFVDKTQTPKIRKEFKFRGISLWAKLGLCAVFTVLLMIFENIEVLTKLFSGSPKQFGGAFDPAVYPTVYIMVSLQLMLLACLCAYEQIANGFKYLFRGVPKPETMLSVLTVVGILYSVILVRVNSGEPVMFNFAVALTALFTLIYAIYNHKREVLNFRIVGNKKPKHIVRRLMDEESEGEARAFEDNDEVCDVMKIEKTDFIDGFFGRLSKPDPATTHFMVALLSVIGAIAVLFGILMKFRGGNADSVLAAAYAALLVVAPVSIYITFSYPFYRANLAAKEYDSAIIGDASLEEYSNASIISFDDKNVFPAYSVKVQNIRIYNNARVDRVFYYAASVFAYAGGPLQDVFEVATIEMGHSANVKIYDTEAGFLATQVDGVNIFFGSSEVLKEHGFEIDPGAEEDDMDLSDELSIMYMFREDKLVAKMYVQYVMDADIDLILKQFSGSGLYVCVRTFDPNIDERMIARKLNMKRMPLKIVRYASAEEVTSYEEKVDSGLVTCGSPKSLLQVISYCEKVLRTRKTNIALGVLSVLIGAAILVLLLLSDSMGLLNSLYIAIYQLIWIIPLAVSSRMFIR